MAETRLSSLKDLGGVVSSANEQIKGAHQEIYSVTGRLDWGTIVKELTALAPQEWKREGDRSSHLSSSSFNGIDVRIWPDGCAVLWWPEIVYGAREPQAHLLGQKKIPEIEALYRRLTQEEARDD